MSEESYVPVDQLAKVLAVKSTTIRDWVNRGHIPKHTYIKVGSTYRFNIPLVLDALKATKDDDVEAQEAAVEERVEVSAPVHLALDFNVDDDV